MVKPNIGVPHDWSYDKYVHKYNLKLNNLTTEDYNTKQPLNILTYKNTCY